MGEETDRYGGKMSQKQKSDSKGDMKHEKDVEHLSCSDICLLIDERYAETRGASQRKCILINTDT